MPAVPAPQRLAALLLLLALLHPLDGRAQERIERTDRPVFPCWLPVTEGSGHRIHAPGPSLERFLRGGGPPTAQFEVTYDGFSQEAQAAFQAAVDVWAQHVVSPVPIRIDAHWVELGANVLGSAGPFLIRDFPGAPVSRTWYPTPLANALAHEEDDSIVDLDPSNADIEANFNRGFPDWYFGLDGNGLPGQVELFTVVLHELGHGLGFIGSATVENGVGDIGLVNDGVEALFIFDRFTEDVSGTSLLNYPDPSAELARVLTVEEAFFGGPTVEAAYGRSAELYTPSVWNPGSSYSHLDETAFPADSADGLMTPNIAPGETKRGPGPLLCAALQDFGWTLAPACADLIPAGPPPPPLPTEPFALDLVGPNPFRHGTALTLTVQARQRVQAWLFDAAGRRVGALLDAVVTEGQMSELVVEGEGLPSGVYFVHVVGETFTTTTAVTNLR